MNPADLIVVPVIAGAVLVALVAAIVLDFTICVLKEWRDR